MNKKQIISISAALVTTLLIAGGTIVALSYLNDKNSDSSNDSGKVAEEEPTTTEQQDAIDSQLNQVATSIDQEAAELMGSNPSAAQQKYQEAKDAYVSAGNLSKAGEMEANAMTARALAEDNLQQ